MVGVVTLSSVMWAWLHYLFVLKLLEELFHPYVPSTGTSLPSQDLSLQLVSLDVFLFLGPFSVNTAGSEVVRPARLAATTSHLQSHETASTTSTTSLNAAV